MNTPRKLDTSYRVIKILRLLHEKPMNMDELCYELDIKELGVNRETISKYLTTLRYFGCVIEKRGGKFRLKHFPFFVNFGEENMQTIAVFEKFAQKLCSQSGNLKIKSALEKLVKLFDPISVEKYQKLFSEVEIKNIYSKYIQKMQMISEFFDETASILYKGKAIRISARRFKYLKSHIYLYAFNEDKRMYALFLLDEIEQITPLPKSTISDFFTSVTTFKIKGRLASGYHLYEGERIIESTESYKVIVNKSQDKDELVSRLLKYGELCELVAPKNEQELLLSKIDKMIANYS